MGYTLASGFIAGVLMSYLSSAQQIFQEVYGLGREFPIYMAALALFVGGASFVNSRIVMRFGMRALSYRAVLLFVFLTTIYLAVTCQMGGRTPLWLMMVFFRAVVFLHGNTLWKSECHCHGAVEAYGGHRCSDYRIVVQLYLFFFRGPGRKML